MMLVPHTDVVFDQAGNSLASVNMTVYQRGTTTTATIYSDSAGASVIANPLTSSYGRVDFWTYPGAYDFVVADTRAPASFLSYSYSKDLAFANPPRTRIYHNSGIAVTNATTFVLSFNSERYDVDNMHSTVTNTPRITINTPGVYNVGAVVSWPGNATGYRALGLRRNGATFFADLNTPNNGAGAGMDSIVSADYQFSAGDYIEVVAQQTSGITLTIPSIGNYTPEAWAHWIGT